MKKEQCITLRNGYVTGTVEIHSEYNPEFIAGIKKLGGKWDPESKVWVVGENKIAEVRALASKVYGYEKYTTRNVTLPIEQSIYVRIPEKMNVTYYEVSANKAPVNHYSDRYPRDTKITFTFA